MVAYANDPACKRARLPHTVSDQPFDPDAIYKYTDAQKALFEASQLRLMWWKFRRHKPALISGIFLGLLYLSILISEFLAPYNLETRNSRHIYAPPQTIHLFHNGQLRAPFVYGFDFKLNMENLKREYVPNPEKMQPIRWFCQRRPVQILGGGRGQLAHRLPGQEAERCSCSEPTGSAATC